MTAAVRSDKKGIEIWRGIKVSSTQPLLGIDLEGWKGVLCKVLKCAMLSGCDGQVVPAVAGEF